MLIVDDEALIRASIRNGLAAREDIVVMGECESGAEAMYAIRQLGPDLVLLDVQMHDGTGLDVIAEIGPERMPAVIFVTAYDEYAVKAFELDAVDYLLKPFDDERLNRSIDRAKKNRSSRRAPVRWRISCARCWRRRAIGASAGQSACVRASSSIWCRCTRSTGSNLRTITCSCTAGRGTS